MEKTNTRQRERAKRELRRYRTRCRKASEGTQLGLDLRPVFGWGGLRDGAGRPPTRAKGEVTHERRERFRAFDPLHLTMRLVDGVDLCAPGVFDVFLRALAGACREDAAFLAYAAEGNHLHALAEARDVEALARSVTAFKCSFVAAANPLLGRSGPAFVGAYHYTVLRGPTQARNALAYLVENAAQHASNAGRVDPRILRDPFASLGQIDLSTRPDWALRLAGPVVTPAPRSWLLRKGWQLALRRTERFAA